ncbi:cyclic nucleotide-binding domain-containing thioredoxin-disulfide reductase [Actinoplanes sp. L3-i22]|uniref:FAD-dependent oxidoreductase n=1 Tax=Actinoplanes sp. L3-i22 TaxID=2836373 RepID=UPI001C78DE78|nr:cyclic nucleotide-binding domain-containing thioredoxin-disulfide reductase [Actinoplanes sp. L3-i22]BCY09214.1 thioredoxin reductase [Actinoplanes sp. L3-i22]
MTAPITSEARPRLTGEQWQRLSAYGIAADAPAGTWIFRAGDDSDMILIESGAVAIVRPATADDDEAIVATYGPRQFTGELNLLTQQSAYLGARATEASLVRRLDAGAFRALMDRDPELSDIVLRALIARRRDLRDGQAARTLEIVGSDASAAALALRTYAARLQLPHTWNDIASPAGAALARAVDASTGDLPVVITPGAVLRHATTSLLAEHLGLSYRPRSDEEVDLVVIGAGPAGLAAGVYGASEGLRTLVLDSVAAGGQAAASSRIENYLGFTSGISGNDLTAAAAVQAQKFGARIASPCQVAELHSEPDRVRVVLADATTIRARAAVIATGARYRALPLQRWADFEGAGIYYAATEIEARACGRQPVAVVGGANSAGQAALYLAARGSRVTLVVRGADLRAGMSSYLADRILADPAITVRTGTEVTALHGDSHLRQITLTGTPAQECAGLFCFIGATPATAWLAGLATDKNGFLRTDSQLHDAELGQRWTELDRRPLPFETSLPRVFAAGDVRAGSMKRVAAAVGEGASAVSSVHAALRTVSA